MPRTSTLFLLFFLMATACEKPSGPEDVEPRLVIFSEFASNRTLEVQVAKTRSIYQGSNDQEYVLDAKVDIYQGRTFLERLALNPEKFPPVYASLHLNPEPNVTYTIEASAPGFETVKGTDKIPSRIRIDHLGISDILVSPGEKPNQVEYQYRVTLEFKDPGSIVNYYHVNFIQQFFKGPGGKEEFFPKSLREAKARFPTLKNDFYIAGSQGGLLFSDETFDGRLFSKSIPLRFYLEEDEHLGPLFVELRSVSEDYYLFQVSLTQQSGPGYPYQGDAPLYNNIQNGQGIFAGYSSSVDSIFVIH
jgi:hypothetical protein